MSEKNADKISLITQIGVITLIVAFFIALLVWQALDGRPASFDLRFNPYAVLSVLSFVANLVAFFLILRLRQRTETTLWFAAFLLSIVCWAGGQAMLRLSATPEAFVFWAPLDTLGSVFMPITLYMFALSYTDRRHSLQPLTLPGLLAVSALFIYLDNHTGLITIYDTARLALAPWGYVCPTGPAYPLIALWLMLLPLASTILLYRFQKRTIDPLLRKQARLFMMAITIPLAGGGITDGLLPALNIVAIPVLSVALLTIMGIVISYGIYRYQFFTFTPSLIAEEIIGTMNEAVFGVDRDLLIGYANVGAEKLLGLPPARFVNHRLHELLSDRRAATGLEGKITQALGEDDFGTIDYLTLRHADGTNVIVKLSITHLEDDGQPYEYLIVATDITTIAEAASTIERKVEERTHELHAEQAKLRASIDSLKLGFMLIDAKERIDIQNKSLLSILKLKHPAHNLRQIEELLNIDLATKCQKVRASGRPGELREVEFGAKVLHLFIAPVIITEQSKQSSLGAVILVQDITEDKVLARSRDEFFSIASHELRTPLTAIKGNASLITSYYAETLTANPPLKEMVSDIHSSSGRLIQIVNDFLDVSRLEQNKVVYQFQALALDKIIGNVIYEMQSVVQSKNITLTSQLQPGLPLVWADPARLTQVIYNLIGNAVKFTNHGGVTITAETKGRFIKITVSDNGPGISVRNQKLLFHKFQQAGKSILTRDATQGTGLGLYISKLLAADMGGKVGLESSEEGKGSTFFVTIPIAKSDRRLS